MDSFLVLVLCIGLMLPGAGFAQSSAAEASPEQIIVLQDAVAMAVAPSGHVFVSIDGGTALVEIDPSTGLVEHRYGVPGEMSQISSVAVSESMNIYLADRTQAVIGRYSRGFRLLDEYRTDGSQQPLTDLNSFVVDDQRRMFAVSARDGVMTYWTGNNPPEVIGTLQDGEGHLLEPVDVALMGRSSVLVLDAGRGAVLEFDRWGSFSGTLVTNLEASADKIVAHHDGFWVIDGNTKTCFDEQGTPLSRYEVDLPEPLLDMATSATGLIALTPGGLYRVHAPSHCDT